MNGEVSDRRAARLAAKGRDTVENEGMGGRPGVSALGSTMTRESSFS